MQHQQYLVALVVVLLTAASLALNPSHAHHKLSREECQAIGKQMENLQSRLRQGHSAKQGRRYRERMRNLRLKRFRKC